MKSFSTIAILLALCSPLGAQSYRILAIGEDCAEPYVEKHIVAMGAADGRTIEFAHADDAADAKAMLRQGRWDAVVLDGRDADASYKRLKRASKGARVLVQQPWAYGKTYLGEPAIIPEFRKLYGCDQAAMYADIVAESRRQAAAGMEIIPVGTAIQDVRSTFDRDNLLRDAVHLNYSSGCYLAACTWYAKLFGADVRQSGYDPGRLFPERLALMRTAANAAVEAPFEVKDFGFRKLNKNYDEARVPQYTLPEALRMADGTPVSTPGQWYSQRRPELLEMFTTQMYGRAPGRPEGMHFEVVSLDDGALAGTAVRKEIRIYFTEGEEHYMTLLMYIPKHVKGPVPVFLGANFFGNPSINSDNGISYPDQEQIERYGVYKRPERGSQQNRWPLGMILSRGYALATFDKDDLAPEWDSSFTRGVFPLFYKDGQDYPEADEWGNISAWAWGYSRALDYLETDSDVDAGKVATIGHSRLSKTALWAAVSDERFAMAVPNNPGCCGAAISRRAFGESLETIIRHYHYWFCGNFAAYGGREDALPFDQHELLALMAPRPVCVGSGEYDRWSDPVGEFIALQEASKVYEFLGLPGLGLEEMPGPWRPQNEGLIGYHMRSGPHEITPYDWEQYLNFADKYLK